MLRRLGPTFVAISLLAGCVPVTRVSSWKDEAFTRVPVRHVLVLAVARDESSRRIFEDRVGKKLAARGVGAVSSYRLLPSQEQLDKEAIEEAIRETEITAILVSQVVSRRTETVEEGGTSRAEPRAGTMGRRGGWHGGYTRGWEVTHDPTVTRNRDVITVKTTLFDVETDAMIWSASYETVLEPPLDPIIDAIASKAVQQLAADGFIP